MVAMLAARLPPRFLALQGVNHPLPVEKRPWRQEIADRCQTRLVIEQHLDRDSFFPALRKLWPVLRRKSPRGTKWGIELSKREKKRKIFSSEPFAERIILLMSSYDISGRDAHQASAAHTHMI